MEKIVAKKRFGQNFLKDEAVLHKIIKAIPKQTTPNFDGNIVEIGPGLGDLTSWLLGSGFKVLSYELDSELVPNLLSKFKKEQEDGNFRLINKDANEVWLQNTTLLHRPYILVANLPYYVATKMILNALEDEFCVAIVCMIQKEVAVKFTCKGGDSEFSSLGVLANLNSHSELLFDVSPQCFEPVPKVVSSVIKIVKNRNLFGSFGLFANKKEYENFKIFLKISFVAPRKTLMKNLSSKFDKGLVKCVFQRLSIEPNIRPHESNVTLYLEIYRLIKEDDERKQRREIGK